MIRVFEQLKPERGLPEKIRVDNGPEFTGSDLKDWAEDQGDRNRFYRAGQTQSERLHCAFQPHLSGSSAGPVVVLIA